MVIKKYAALFLFSLLAGSSFLPAQSLAEFRFTASFSQTPLEEVIERISDEFPLDLSFAAATIAGKTTDCEFENAPWSAIVDCLFKPLGIDVLTVGNHYVVLQPAKADRHWPISLNVKDETGNSLPFVTIHHPASGRSFSADDEGSWRGEVIGRATDSLEISFLGYATFKATCYALSQKQNASIAMSPDGVELGEVTVTEYLTDGINSGTSGQPVVLNPQKMSAIPGYAENAVFRAVELLPGIHAPDETSGNLQIRGGSRDQNLVLWDGIPVYGGGHYFGHISLFEPDLIDRIEVWRGTADASYGGRLSGIVKMETKQDLVHKPKAALSANLTHLQAYVKTPVGKKVDTQLSYRTSWSPLLNLPTYDSYGDQVFQGTLFSEADGTDDEDFNIDQNFTFRELNARVLWKPNEKSQIRASFFSQSDDFSAGLDFDDSFANFSDEVNEINQGGSLTYTQQGTGNKQWEYQLAFSNFTSGVKTNLSDPFSGLVFFSQEKDNHIADRMIRVERQIGVGSQNRLKFGTELHLQEGDFEVSQLDSVARFVTDRVDRSPFTAAAYSSFSYRPDKKIQVDFGLRLQYYDLTDRLYFEPRIQGSYHLKTDWTLKFAFGRNHQFLSQILELDFNPIAPVRPVWVQADGDELSIPSSTEISTGFLHRRKGWLVDVEAYFKKVDNLSSLNFQQNLGAEGSTLPDFFSTGSTRSFGLDVLIKKRWGPFRSWLIYTLSKTDLLFKDVSPGYFPAFNDQRHRLKWVNSYSRGNWLFSLGSRLQTGTRFTDVDLEFVGQDPNTGAPLIASESGPPNGGRLPLYHRIDLSVFYTWSPGKESPLRLKIGCSLLNVLGQRNILSRNFQSFNDSEDPFPVVTEKMGLYITPNLSVKLSWE